MKICKENNKQVYKFDGGWIGLRGIYVAILWVGFKEWIKISLVRRCIATEHEIYNAFTGN